ncbi:MAG: AAA family ATPase [Pseudomonadota bacterium]
MGGADQATAPAPRLADAEHHIYKVFGSLIDHGGRVAFCRFEYDGDGRPVVKGGTWPLTAEGIAAGLAAQERANAQGHSIYFKPGVVRDDYTGNPSRITDADIIACGALWVDCDFEHECRAVDAGEPAPSFHVITGTAPSLRRQSWWALEKPTRNMAAWRALSADCSAFFGSDSAVVNPSTWMRLAGFVSYPKPGKPGRIVERVCGAPGAGRSYAFDTLLEHWGGSCSASVRGANIHSDPERFIGRDDGWTLDDGSGAADAELIALLNDARQPGRWNNNVFAAVSSLVGRGDGDESIRCWVATHGRVDEHAAELEDIIERVRRTLNKPEPRNGSVFALSELEVDIDADVGPVIQSAADFAAGFVAPEYLVDGVVRRSYCYSFTAPTGAGKTAIALDLAFAVALGRPFANLPARQGPVVFMAGENPDDVRARVLLMAHVHGVDLEGLPLYFIASRFDIAADMDRLRELIEEIGGAALAIVDTSAAYFRGDDENNNPAMAAWAATLRRLCELPGAPSVVVPCHPVKNWSRENMTPRGGGAFLAEVDGNLALIPAGGAITLTTSGKHRGPEFEPLTFEIEAATCPQVADAEGRLIPSAIAKHVSERREEELSRQELSNGDAVLMDMSTAADLSIAERCRSLGWVSESGEPLKSKLHRALTKLRDAGLVREFRAGRYRLTPEGKTEAQALRNIRGDVDFGG